MKTIWDRLCLISIVVGICSGFSIFLFPSGGLKGPASIFLFITFICACYAIFYRVRAELGNKINARAFIFTAIAIPVLFIVVWWINN